MAEMQDSFYKNQDTPDDTYNGYLERAKTGLEALVDFKDMTLKEKDCWIHQRLWVLECEIFH